MNKKLTGALAAMSIALSVFTAASAAQTPKVFVDDREITFEDQVPVIQDDHTLVPLRGVFEALNADVQWDGEARRVRIESADHLYRVFITIDSNIMEVYKILGVNIAGEIPVNSSKIELETPAIIMNDRTMVPLRAISESIGCDVEWLEDTFTADIKSKDYKLWIEDNGEVVKDARPIAALTTEATAAAKDETFDIYMTIEGLNKITTDKIAAITSTILYDPAKFELVDAHTVMPDGTQAEGFSDIFNASFSADSLKFVGLNALSQIAPTEDVQKIAKFTFKSLTGEEGVFSLSPRVDSVVGNDVGIITINPENYDMVGYEDTKTLVLDTEAITIAAK